MENNILAEKKPSRHVYQSLLCAIVYVICILALFLSNVFDSITNLMLASIMLITPCVGICFGVLGIKRSRETKKTGVVAYGATLLNTCFFFLTLSPILFFIHYAYFPQTQIGVVTDNSGNSGTTFTMGDITEVTVSSDTKIYIQYGTSFFAQNQLADIDAIQVGQVVEIRYYMFDLGYGCGIFYYNAVSVTIIKDYPYPPPVNASRPPCGEDPF